MRSALLDTGTLVALVNRRDRFHREITALLKDYDGRFLSTWPVITEACSFMADRSQRRVLDWIAIANVELVSIDDGLDAMRAIMDKYSDLPCDFADASLVYAATKTNVCDIWSLDRDFTVFSLPDRKRFTVIPGAK